jgi:tetratricopeptide (TPR) repeat protein
LRIICQALDFLIIAAHLTPKDAQMWADLASRSRTQGKLKQAIYCLNRAIKIEPEADELLWDKAKLLQETSQHRRAIDVLSTALKKIDACNYGKALLLLKSPFLSNLNPKPQTLNVQPRQDTTCQKLWGLCVSNP